MRRNEALDFVTSELSSRGIRFETATSGSNHIEIRWQVPDKEVRNYFVPNSPSDHRGRLNARAHVRRLLKQDGVDLEKPNEHMPRKPRQLLAHALDLPKHELTIPEQLKALRMEITDLTELMLDVSSTLSVLRDHILHHQPAGLIPAPSVAPPVDHPSPPEPEPGITQAARTRRVVLMDYLSHNWNSFDALSRDTGLNSTQLYSKLHYLKNVKGAAVEFDTKRARLKAPKTKPHVVSS